MEPEAGIWSTVLGLAGLLMLAVLMLPAARRLDFPYTVLLAAVGVGIGLVQLLLGDSAVPVLGDLLRALGGLEITADAVLFVFLPALVFEAALALDVRRLMDDIGPILLMAIIGLLFSTIVIGLSLWQVSGVALVACLMLGAICSATDPVAVVAIFKEVGAPKRLSILVEGESLFNDATAIVAFTILAGMLTSGTDPSFGDGLMAFLTVFLGGMLVGWLMARLFVAIIGQLEDMPLVEQSLTISLAYLSFIVAEHYLHVSGVMAVVIAALVLASRGRTVIQPHDWHSLHVTWEQIGFWANSIIFILVGLAVPSIMLNFGSEQLLWLIVLIVVAFLARAVIIFGLLPLLSGVGMAQSVPTGFKLVMLWGGLRGAVALALALVVIETPGHSEEVRQFVAMLVTGFVLFTLFVNAPTVGWVIRFFRLDQLSPTDAALRDRALALSLGSIGDSIETVGRRQDASRDTIERIAGAYRVRSEQAERQLESLGDLPVRDWVQVGLTNLTARERLSCDHQFEDGFLSSAIYRIVSEQIDDLTDALKQGGPEAYRARSAQALDFGRDFRFAMLLQRRFGFAGPLSRRVAERFEVLTSVKLALKEAIEDGLPRVREVVGPSAGQEVEALLRQRHEQTAAALDSLEKQYPDYARRIELRLLERGALRLEAQSYRRMYADALISGEVHGDLEALVREREREIEAVPALDLGLEPRRLVGQVPMFRDLPADRIGEIVRLLEPRLVLPGELVVHRGDTGDAMYFVSSGSLRVDLTPAPVTLGSGDFFGELALITHQPRNADVVATGFADLLVLRTEAFQRLMDSDPDLRSRIETVARDRLGAVPAAAAKEDVAGASVESRS